MALDDAWTAPSVGPIWAEAQCWICGKIVYIVVPFVGCIYCQECSATAYSSSSEDITNIPRPMEYHRGGNDNA